MYLMKLYFFLSSYFQKLGFSHQAKKKYDNVVTTGKFYTMPHPLKVEGRATPLLLLMTLHEKEKSFIFSGIQQCSPQPIHDHWKN